MTTSHRTITEKFVPVENVVDLFTDIRSEAEELAIYPMQDGLKEVSFTWVFTVKQLQQLQRPQPGLTDSFTSHSRQNRSFHKGSSWPISWIVLICKFNMSPKVIWEVVMGNSTKEKTIRFDLIQCHK